MAGKANCGAGCRYSRNYYKKAKRLFDAPQPGDQIFFWPKDAIGGPAVAHTGLVYRVDGTYVYTIEGNTSGANGVVANGGGVCKKKYRLTYNRIAGYGRPDWGVEAADAPAADPAATNARHILVKANSVNLRAGDGVKYASVGHANRGARLEWVATAQNGWYAVRKGAQVAWISGRYAALEGGEGA